MRWARSLLGTGIAAALSLAACSGGGSGNDSASSAPPPPAATSSAGASASTAHEVLVTNDDGVSAPGIDAVVTALRGVPGVHVTVVAPAKNQSGTGGKTTTGTLTYTSAKTASGSERYWARVSTTSIPIAERRIVREVYRFAEMATGENYIERR